MGRRLPPLNSLRAFEAAARLSSFAEASKELHLTAAAIAHQVKKLEQALGIELFDRGTRGVVLNEAGRAYQRVVERLLDDLARETGVFEAQHLGEPLRIAALHVVCERLVRPMAESFLTRYPAHRAELIADVLEPDFRSGTHDVFVWHGCAPQARFLSRKIMSETLTPVCAPQLLERYPYGMQVSDLAGIPVLYDLYWQDDWNRWLQAAGGPPLHNRMGFSLYSVMIQSVMEGEGIALGHTGLLRRELAAGQLVRPFALSIEDDRAYYALTTADSLRKPAVSAFWHWLEASAG